MMSQIYKNQPRIWHDHFSGREPEINEQLALAQTQAQAAPVIIGAEGMVQSSVPMTFDPVRNQMTTDQARVAQLATLQNPTSPSFQPVSARLPQEQLANNQFRNLQLAGVDPKFFSVSSITTDEAGNNRSQRTAIDPSFTGDIHPIINDDRFVKLPPEMKPKVYAAIVGRDYNKDFDAVEKNRLARTDWQTKTVQNLVAKGDLQFNKGEGKWYRRVTVPSEIPGMPAQMKWEPADHFLSGILQGNNATTFTGVPTNTDPAPMQLKDYFTKAKEVAGPRASPEDVSRIAIAAMQKDHPQVGSGGSTPTRIDPRGTPQKIADSVHEIADTTKNVGIAGLDMLAMLPEMGANIGIGAQNALQGVGDTINRTLGTSLPVQYEPYKELPLRFSNWLYNNE